MNDSIKKRKPLFLSEEFQLTYMEGMKIMQLTIKKT
jgi:hypothetical protein